MIKVYNGDAYGIQEDDYDRNRSLQFFLNGHKNEYILIYRGDRLLKVLSYYDAGSPREGVASGAGCFCGGQGAVLFL